jgi:hypothetical protein
LSGELKMSVIRKLAIALGTIEAVAIMAVFSLLLLQSQSSDPLGSAIGQGLAKLLAVPFLLCVVPGLFLAWANRLVYVALALVVLALPLAAILWRGA